MAKIKSGREQFEQFTSKLDALLGQINASPNESEEHHKNHLSDFLKLRFPACFINTNERIDSALQKALINPAFCITPDKGAGISGDLAGVVCPLSRLPSSFIRGFDFE